MEGWVDVEMPNNPKSTVPPPEALEASSVVPPKAGIKIYSGLHRDTSSSSRSHANVSSKREGRGASAQGSPKKRSRGCDSRHERHIFCCTRSA